MKHNYKNQFTFSGKQMVIGLLVLAMSFVTRIEAQCTASAGALTPDATPVAIANGGVATVSHQHQSPGGEGLEGSQQAGHHSAPGMLHRRRWQR